MKINSIKIKGLLGQNYDVFLKLDDISNGCDEIFCSVADLSAITDFLFLNKHGNFRFDGSAECDFVHNGNSYQKLRQRRESFALQRKRRNKTLYTRGRKIDRPV